MIEKTLKKFGYSKNVITVYDYLVKTVSAEIKQMIKDLNLPRASIYDSLDTLIAEGLVRVSTDGKTKLYSADLKDLSSLLKQKANSLQEDQQVLEKLLLETKDRPATIPEIRIFRHRSGIVEMFNFLLKKKNKKAYIRWSIGGLRALLGNEFVEYFSRRLMDNKISMQVIWTDTAQANREVVKKIQQTVSFEARRLQIPVKDQPKISYIICDDMVMYMVFGVSAYGVLVESFDFAKLETAHFKALWSTLEE